MSMHESRFSRVAALVAGPTRWRRSAWFKNQLLVQFDTLLQALDVHAARHFDALRVHPAVIR